MSCYQYTEYKVLAQQKCTVQELGDELLQYMVVFKPYREVEKEKKKETVKGRIL